MDQFDTNSKDENYLLKDLTFDLQEQKQILKDQFSVIDPLATALSKNVAQRVLNTSLLVILEIISYLMFLMGIAFFFLMDKFYPYYMLSKITNNVNVISSFSETDIANFTIGIKALAIVIGLLFLIIARMLSKARKKNALLTKVGKELKTLAGQNLTRRSAIETLEQKHIMILPSQIEVDGVVIKEHPNSLGDPHL